MNNMDSQKSSIPSDDLPICTACGTQFDEQPHKGSCRICDDPRQFVPPTGQSWTTISAMKSGNPTKYSNKHKTFPSSPRFISIWTEPKFAIGQRCILIKTPSGNILWDCISYLDDETISWIKSEGGIAAIVISHPHYYTTHLEWVRAFDCPVYTSAEDEEWICRRDDKLEVLLSDESMPRVPISGEERDIIDSGVKAIKLGGHFPGSLVCLYDGRLLIADTLVTTPSGMGDWKEKQRPTGMNSFAFMWSIPNMIPLPPDDIAKMWSVLKKHDFTSTHGAFVGTDIESPDIKRRVLESMQIQCRGEGHGDHALLNAKL